MADNDFYGDLSSSSEGSDIINDTTESDISVSSSDSDDGRNGSEYEHLSPSEEDEGSDYPIETQPLSLRALAKLRTRSRLVPAAPVSPLSLTDISLRALQNVSAPVDPQAVAGSSRDPQPAAGSRRDPQFQDAESPRKRFKAGDRFSLRDLPHVRYADIAEEEQPVDTDPVPVVTGRTGVRMASYVERSPSSPSSDEDYLPPSDDEDRLPGFGRGRRVTGRKGPGRPPKARRGRGRVGRGGEDVPQDVGHGYQADMEDVDDPADIAPADIAPVADPAAIAPVAPGIYIYFFHSICI